MQPSGNPQDKVERWQMKGTFRRAIFLDRDGVLNAAIVQEGRPYPPQTVEDFSILPGVSAACRALVEAGFILVVATNQPDVGRGTQAQHIVEEMHRHLADALPIAHIAVCYHAGGAVGCDCRKPKPGMLLESARLLSIDLSGSYMVGDRWRDIDCGNAAGCQSIFIDHGYDESLRSQPIQTVRNLEEASSWILAQQSNEVNRENI